MKRLLLSSFAALGLVGAPAHAVLIDLVHAAPDEVDIVVSGLGGVGVGEIVSAFDILVTFDPLLTADFAIVGDHGLGWPDYDGNAVSYLDDTFLTGWTIRAADWFTPGEVSLFELSLLSDAELLAQQPDSFRLGTIVFEADLANLDGFGFVWDVALELDVKGLNGEVIFPSSEVPEPATLFLLGSGLLGFGLTRRRRARS